MLEAVLEALHEIGKSLKKQESHMAPGAMSWLFLTVKDIKEKDIPLQEAQEQAA